MCFEFNLNEYISQDAYKKVLDANPEVQSWLEEIQILSQKVAAEGQKCKQLTGLKQTLVLFCIAFHW